MYYVYILYSPAKDRYYIGSTGNLRDRLLRHQQGRSKSTKYGRPWLLVYTENFPVRSQAVQREMAIKRQKSKHVLFNLAKNYLVNPFPLPEG